LLAYSQARQNFSALNFLESYTGINLFDIEREQEGRESDEDNDMAEDNYMNED